MTTVKVEPYMTKLQQPEPELVVATAQPISQEDAVAPTPTAPPADAKSKKNRTGFDLMCCGDDTKKGIRVQPGTNFAIKLCGNTNVILPEDPPAGAHYKFIVINLCGDAKFLVPSGTKVVLRRISLCGNRTIDTEEENDAASPIDVTVTILQLCGDVKVINHGSEELSHV
jgi:hypothetical protein